MVSGGGEALVQPPVPHPLPRPRAEDLPLRDPLPQWKATASHAGVNPLLLWEEERAG